MLSPVASVPCPGDHTSWLPCPLSGPQTPSSRDSGDFWSPQRAPSLTQVWSSLWSSTLTANITLMDPWQCLLIIRRTVPIYTSSNPFLLYFTFNQTWGSWSYWQYCGTCKLWARPEPLTVSSCDGRETRILRLLRSGVGSADCVQTKKCRETCECSASWHRLHWWPLTMGGAPCHTPDLSWCDILILTRLNDFAFDFAFYYLKENIPIYVGKYLVNILLELMFEKKII